MMKSAIRLRIAGYVAALASVGLFGAGVADAGSIYRGNFDPLEYWGTVEVDLPNTCVGTTGWIAAGTAIGECGQVDILSLVVNNPPPPPTSTDSLTFAPPTLTNAVTGLWWNAGVLSGIDTPLLGPAGPSGGPFFTNPYGYVIAFDSGHFNNDISRTPTVELYSCDVETCDGITPVGDTAATQRSFIRVPEPGSVALILAAAAAGWLGRRRTRAS